MGPTKHVKRPSSVRHYCRHCGSSFEDTTQVSAHSQYRDHLFHTHRPEYRTAHYTCTRHCVARAQADELRLDHQVYGEGGHSALPKMTYEQLVGGD